MQQFRKKITMDGIRRNSNPARRVLSYPDFKRSKKQEARSKENNVKFKNIIKFYNFIIFNFINKLRYQISLLKIPKTTFNAIFKKRDLVRDKSKFLRFKHLGIRNYLKIQKLKIKNFLKPYYLKKLAAVAVIIFVLITAYFQKTFNTYSASDTWTQTQWSTQSSNTTSYPAPANWTEYSSVTSNVSTGTALSISSNSTSTTHTTTAEFGGTKVNTVASSDSVVLDPGSAPYSTSGTYESTTIDTGALSNFNTLNFGLTIPAAAGSGEIPDTVSGLQGLYHMNDTNWYDTSSNGNNLTPFNMLTGSAKFGASSGSFNGTSSYLYRTDANLSANFPGKNGTADIDFTLEAWVNTSVSGATQIIMAKYNNTGKTGFLMAIDYDGVAVFASNAPGVGAAAYGATAVNDGQWHHIAGAHDSANDLISIYVDGKLDSNGSLNPLSYSGGVGTNDLNFTIGRRLISGAEAYFNGSIDEAAVYNRVLFADEIAAHHAALKFQAAASNCSNGANNSPACDANIGWGDSDTPYLGIDGTANTYFISSGQTIPAAMDGNQYFRYKAYLSTADTTATPSLDDVTVNYSYYPNNQTLISSPFDSADAADVMGGLSWTEDASLPAGTTVTVSLKTAATQGGLAGASWYDFTVGSPANCTKASATVTCTADALDARLKDGSGDQWYQYKVTLTSTGINTPTIPDVSVTYNVNSPPVISVASATQNSDGTLSMVYDLSDPDSSSFTVSAYADIGITLNGNINASVQTITVSDAALLPVSGTIETDNEQITYTGKSGNDLTGCARGANGTTAAAHSSGAVAWAKAATATGNIGVSQLAGNGKTITWTIKNDYNGVYRNSSDGKIRISANDGRTINEVGSGDSSSFAIDTKDPTGASVAVDASTVPAAAALNAADDTALQMKVGLVADLSDAAWETYATSKTITLVTDPDTVYAEFRDAFGNTSAIISSDTLETPDILMIQDNSNMGTTPPEYRLFLAWKTVADPALGFSRYDVWRSTDGISYASIGTVNSRTTNYYTDATVAYDTLYYYKISLHDAGGNNSYLSEAVSGKANGTQDAGEGSAPLTAISGIADPPSVLTDTKAIITFTTNQPAQCYVEYGANPGNYNEVPVVESSYDARHSLTITNLTEETDYYYRITCADGIGNSLFSSEYNFTTLQAQYSQTDAPNISNVKAGTITGESATITWDTDKDANSLVKYGITKDYENMAGDSAVNSDFNNYAKTHSVTINNLVPAVKYYYAAMSIDMAGVIGESSQKTFTTKSVSSISSIKVDSRNLNEAIITWKTAEDTTSIVEYGLSDSYGEKKELASKSKDHEITLSSLESSRTYHLRVSGQDKDNNLYSSADYTFEPKSPPQISGFEIISITEHSAIIKFSTNIPTDALATYADINDPGNSSSQGRSEISSRHEIEIKNLSQGTTYSVKIKVRDENGNETEKPFDNFTTGKDANPPKIEQIRTDSALAQNNKVQTIISWNTDEPATTALLYKEGRNGEEKEAKISDNSVLVHVAVITVFKPGSLYYFKAKSADQSGNVAVSGDYAFLTPQKKENIIQIIINNFYEIFKWAKF